MEYFDFFNAPHPKTSVCKGGFEEQARIGRSLKRPSRPVYVPHRRLEEVPFVLEIEESSHIDDTKSCLPDNLEGKQRPDYIEKFLDPEQRKEDDRDDNSLNLQ